MISLLRGKLIEKRPPFLMIDVQGVGYLLQAPLSTFFVLPEMDREVKLHTHFIVREDGHFLYGFATREECSLFQEIIKINGVGPKIALALLSGLSVQEFRAVVMSNEITRLTGIPGIGTKTAQRILVEMGGKTPKTVLPDYDNDALQAVSALVALGYKPQEASNAVAKVKDSVSCEQIIREALQGLAKI